MEYKRKDLLINKHRIIEKLSKQVEVQAERVQMLINNKVMRWKITAQCEKLRQTIQEGTKTLRVSDSSLWNSSLSHGISCHRGQWGVRGHKRKDDRPGWSVPVNIWHLQLEIQNNSGWNTRSKGPASSSRANSLERSSRRTYDHIKTNILNMDSSVN